ncbi:adenylate/guanylate cyclase domain-containing protein [Roseivirga sp.]|uniref:adenylate/guanylate cyclase domain-containing protein n=1 Tax=Roseivirga sp. TaxID=1964215 RepID=UPI003B8CA479
MKQFAPKSKRNIQRILPFGLIWLLTSWVFLFTEYAAAGIQSANFNGVIALSPEIVVFSSFAVFLVGLAVGVLEVRFFGRLFQRYALGKKILLKFIFYLCFALIVILIFYPLAGAIETGKSPIHPNIWKKFGMYLTSISFVSTMVQISFSLVCSLLYAAISDSLGHNVLLNFFTGKYHMPTQEERIFMFLDMRDSTGIAERLGHREYFKLLKLYYQSMSDAIVNSSGEVYQYIGDEVVVSWPLNKGLANASCLKCFFGIKASFQEKSENFKKEFGVMPTFKAGVHMGEVTTGEVGALKTEIVFTGDVLNTTSRIQSLYNEFKADLLISQALHTRLKDPNTFGFKALGSLELKGKKKSVTILEVTRS